MLTVCIHSQVQLNRTLDFDKERLLSASCPGESMVNYSSCRAWAHSPPAVPPTQQPALEHPQMSNVGQRALENTYQPRVTPNVKQNVFSNQPLNRNG
jgi:hypothetical protein